MTKIENYRETVKNWVNSHLPLTDIKITLTTFAIILISNVIISKYIFGLSKAWQTRNAWVAAFYFSTLVTVAILLSFRRKKSLFLAIALWTLLSVACYTVLSWLWGGRFLAGWTSEKPLIFKELLSTTLAAVGGIGAVGYLVIKYREQASTEREELHQNEGEADKKLADAVQQLGSESPQVRIAGAYALADVADTYGSENYGVDYNKRVVEILCGYLRTDRHIKVDNATTPNLTENSTEEFDVNHPRFTCNVSDTMEYPKELFQGIEDIGKTATEKEIIQNPVLNSDGPTESAILSILRDHLRFYPPGSSHPEDSHPGPWSCYHINLDGATIMEPIDFQYTHTSKLSCQRTIFYNEVNFTGANFQDTTNFRGCTFVSQTSFQFSSFHHDIDFSPAGDRITTFMYDADFRSVEFSGETTFQHTKFATTVSFAPREKGARRTKFIKIANFRGALFGGMTIFNKVTFQRLVDFSPDLAEYNTNSVMPADDTLGHPARFTNTIFTDAYFIDGADFECAKIDELTNFQGALFNEDLKEVSDMHFPPTITLTSDGLPEGAKWTEFINDEPTLTARRESHQQSESA